MRRCLYTDTVGLFGSLAILAPRLVMGVAFVIHGWPKIQSPFTWMGPDGTMPGILLALAALAEFGGGLALVAGFLTRLAALGVGAVMAVAVGLVHVPAGHPFVAQGGPSYELATIYLACAFLFLILGAGRFSLDALVFGKCCRAKPPADQS